MTITPLPALNSGYETIPLPFSSVWKSTSASGHPITLHYDCLHTQATIGAAVKESVLAAARCVAVRLCAQIGRTHVAAQLVEDAILRGKVADARLDASIREKLAQVAAMKRDAEELEIAGAKGKSEDMKREAEELERAVESLKRAKP